MSRLKKIIDYISNKEGEHICLDCMFKNLNLTSTQYSGDTRQLRTNGYLLGKTPNGHYNRMEYCPECGKCTSHIVYKRKEDIDDSRVIFSHKDRKRIFRLLGHIDAFTGQKTTGPTIDHKTPYTRYNDKRLVCNMSDCEIKSTYQILSNHHNTEKDRACQFCKSTGRRPPFLAFGPDYYNGNSEYTGTCLGCGWYDGNAWRNAHIQGTLIRDEQIINLAKQSKRGISILNTLDGFKELVDEFGNILKKNDNLDNSHIIKDYSNVFQPLF